VQFTPDVLPSDITGYTLLNMKTGEQEVHHGAIMSQLVLADEINRTSPKTQSSLLEAMQEHQVTIDGVSYPLPEPFMVIATQNPVELTGTYPLPEAQLDRFFIRVSLGYPSRSEEVDILESRCREEPHLQVKAVATPQEYFFYSSR
jgi:MoxR-like ATPase